MASSEYDKAFEFDQRAAQLVNRRRPPDRRMSLLFAFAAAVLFAGTLFVGFSARNIDRTPPLSVPVPPSSLAPTNISLVNPSPIL